jgi:hypothetical protein
VSPIKFQSKWRNYTWIVRKTGRRYYPNGDSELIPGLIVEFQGPAHIFDSEAAQRQFDWDDETRIMVENKILKHPQFGFGLYLAPGETLDDAQREIVGDKLKAPERRCAEIWTEEYNIIQCPEMSVPGTEYCEKHSKETPKVIHGMMSTAGKVE